MPRAYERDLLLEEMNAQVDDHEPDGECWNCGGEGRVAGTCIDGCCLEQDDPYCEYCSHRCDICNGKGSLQQSPQQRQDAK